MTLQEYTCIAEKLISSFKIAATDEMVYEVVKAMAKSDLKELDSSRSNMNRRQLRRQDGIYAIRRHLYNKRKQSKDSFQDVVDKREPFSHLVYECNMKVRRQDISRAAQFFNKTNELDDNEKKYLYMLLDGYSLKDIVKENKTVKRKVVSAINHAVTVYNSVKGGVA